MPDLARDLSNILKKVDNFDFDDNFVNFVHFDYLMYKMETIMKMDVKENV